MKTNNQLKNDFAIHSTYGSNFLKRGAKCFVSKPDSKGSCKVNFGAIKTTMTKEQQAKLLVH